MEHASDAEELRRELKAMTLRAETAELYLSQASQRVIELEAELQLAPAQSSTPNDPEEELFLQAIRSLMQPMVGAKAAKATELKLKLDKYLESPYEVRWKPEPVPFIPYGDLRRGPPIRHSDAMTITQLHDPIESTWQLRVSYFNAQEERWLASAVCPYGAGDERVRGAVKDLVRRIAGDAEWRLDKPRSDFDRLFGTLMSYATKANRGRPPDGSAESLTIHLRRGD